MSDSATANPYETGLDKNAANFVPLSPIGFLLRSAAVFPNRISVIHGERRYTWRQSLERCRRRTLIAAFDIRGVRSLDGEALVEARLEQLVRRVSKARRVEQCPGSLLPEGKRAITGRRSVRSMWPAARSPSGCSVRPRAYYRRWRSCSSGATSTPCTPSR